MQNSSNEWLKTTNLQLSQKSFKTCLRKLIILEPFIPFNDFFFFIFKNQTKKKRKNFKLPQKSAKGNAIYIVNALKVFLKKMKQKRSLKKI